MEEISLFPVTDMNGVDGNIKRCEIGSCSLDHPFRSNVAFVSHRIELTYKNYDEQSPGTRHMTIP